MTEENISYCVGTSFPVGKTVSSSLEKMNEENSEYYEKNRIETSSMIVKKKWIPPSITPRSFAPSRGIEICCMDSEVMILMEGKHHLNKVALSLSVQLPPRVPTFTAESRRSESDKNDSTREGGNGEFMTKVGNKTISSTTPCRRWEWSSFTTSARSDRQEFRHWVRTGIEYPDYPYARFDIHLDPINYTDEEYMKYLQHKTWTKSDTDRLIQLARVLELRWAVIFDRWNASSSYFNNNNGKDESENYNSSHFYKIEDLQHRFYTVAAIISQARIAREASSEVTVMSTSPNVESSEQHIIESAAARSLASLDPQYQPLMESNGTGTSNKEVFDLRKERERRNYLELLWKRNKEEEEEEVELRKELKLIEMQLRKLKKSGGHTLLIAAGVGGRNPAEQQYQSQKQNQHCMGPSRNSIISRAISSTPSIATDTAVTATTSFLDKAFSSTAPIPTPGIPYLQSGRLNPPGSGGSLGINKALLKRMDAVLDELKVNNSNNSNSNGKQVQHQRVIMIPTKRTCDMFDSVRKDVLTLLLLEKAVIQKEGQLQAKRLRLVKRNNLGSAASMNNRSSLSFSLLEDEAMIMGILSPTSSKNPPNVPARPKPKAKNRSSSASSSKNNGGKGIVNKSATVASSASHHQHHHHTSSKLDAKGDGSTVTATNKTNKKSNSKKRKKSDAKNATTGTAAVTSAAVVSDLHSIINTTSPSSIPLSSNPRLSPSFLTNTTKTSATSSNTVIGDEKGKKRARKT